MSKRNVATILTGSFIFLAMQVAGQNQFEGGLKGGINFSDVAITNYINNFAEPQYQIKVGLHAGVFASIPVWERSRFATEVLYSNKGVKAVDRVNLHYINIPLLVQYELSEKFIVEVGPELGYLVSARSDNESVSNIWNNKLDIGLDAGAQMKGEYFVVGLRFYAGFSSVIDGIDESATNYFPTEERIKYQNRTLQLFVGLNVFR